MTIEENIQLIETLKKCVEQSIANQIAETEFTLLSHVSKDSFNFIMDETIKKLGKIEKIEQIINDYKNGDEMEYIYLSQIREVLESED